MAAQRTNFVVMWHLFYRGQLEELIICMQQIATEWQTLKDMLDAHEWSPHAYRAVAVPTGARGRPRFQITQEQLEYLCSLSFSWNDISEMLGVSRMTIYRYRRDFNMINETHQTLTDHQLRAIITELRSEIPSIGETMVMGHLRARGYSVTRERMRRAIHSTDPINTLLRWRGNLSCRRPYSVPGPNSLWHIGKCYYKSYKLFLYKTAMVYVASYIHNASFCREILINHLSRQYLVPLNPN